MSTVVRKLFLEVDDVAGVANDVERSLFVPTRLTLELGEHLVLGLRLPHAKRALELPVVVVGRRLPRSGSLLSAGVMVKLADPQHPLFEVLREVAAGRVVDLEARLQERLRFPARVRFASVDEARADLLGLVGEDGAILNVAEVFVRGDRLALDVDVKGVVVATFNVLVRTLLTNEGKTQIVATALDEAARVAVGAFLNNEDVGSRRA